MFLLSEWHKVRLGNIVFLHWENTGQCQLPKVAKVYTVCNLCHIVHSFDDAKMQTKISYIRNTPLVKLTFFMWKTLQIFSTITYSYSLLAACGTHGSCVVVFLYDWHNISVDTT